MIKTTIGNINLGFDIQQPLIRRRVIQHYKKFVSEKDPDILIKVKNEDFNIVLEGKPIIGGKDWEIYERKANKFIYFKNDLTESLAKCNSTLELINFYTQDKKGQLLLYLFPEILFSWLLPLFNSLMLHSCGVIDEEKGYLFIAPDEGGKSTIAKLAIRKGFTVLNDDRIIINKQENRFKMYSTPWYGEVKNISNESSYIKKIFFLKKAQENRIKPVNKIDSITEFYKNSFYLPIEDDIIKKVFRAITGMVSNLDCYWFHFKSDETIWRYLDEYFR